MSDDAGKFGIGETRESISFFLFKQCVQLVILFSFFAFAFPAFWHGQIASNIIFILLTVVVFHGAFSLIEFIFHRYILHMSVIPFFHVFNREHEFHHGITSIRHDEADGESYLVTNEYPIQTEKQRKNSSFPWWALLGFSAAFTPLIFLLQYLLPHLPVVLGGYIALFISYVGYEVIHAFEHRPYEEWWKPRIENKIFGVFWRRAYTFHLMHHANTRTNNAVFGFFGIPVWDFVFKTYKHPSTLFPDRREVPKTEFSPSRPVALIRWLDNQMWMVNLLFKKRAVRNERK